jgi:hypothetical protein
MVCDCVSRGLMNATRYLFSRRYVRIVICLAVGPCLLSAVPETLFAQTDSSPLIKVESHEVVLPFEVMRETKDPKGKRTNLNGEVDYHVWLLHSQEITGLTSKSVHIFEDGVEQSIQHLSFEKMISWEVFDNVGRHLEYSCTPSGIWTGPDITQQNIELLDESKIHTYLLTYIPPATPLGSCHRISVTVDKKHATVFAPDKYCNTKDPLSDPLKDTDFGNRLVKYINSGETDTLPITIQVTPASGRANVSLALPANLLQRNWDGILLHTSIAVLGLVFDRDGALVSRFSDIACWPSKSRIGYDGPIPPDGKVMQEFEEIAIPSGYRTQVELGPGDYQLQLVATDGQKYGRAKAIFKIDDPTKSVLTISGIALCKRFHKTLSGERGPTRAPQYEPLMFEDIQFTPTGDTNFRRDEQFGSFFEIYKSQLVDAASALRLQVKITDVKTGEVKRDSGVEPLNLSFDAHKSSISVVRTISIDALPPGGYRLEMQVSDSAGHKTEWGEATFTAE